MKWWRLIGEYDAEGTAFSALAGVVTSPYTPDTTGRLTGLRAITNRAAATTLQNHVQFRLTCTTFEPNTIEVGAQGAGIQTALVPETGPTDWDIDQKVVAGVPITIEARNVTADTPVTVQCELYGRFEN